MGEKNILPCGVKSLTEGYRFEVPNKKKHQGQMELVSQGVGNPSRRSNLR